MTRNNESRSLQYAYFAVASIFALAFTGVLSVSNRAFFQPYFGHVNPQLVVVLVVALGCASITYLQSRAWFEIVAKGKCLWGVLVSVILASACGVVVIAVDLFVGFPKDINVPLPQSLLFYPAIAYVVEIVFHALPLTILFICFGPFFKNRNETNRNHFVWFCIVFVAVLEPVFHMSVAMSSQSFSGLDVYVGLHVFVINLLQLVIFRRYGFISMLSLRLVYYFIWHIGWGHLRLQLMF